MLPRALWLLEQVDVVYAHERPLGHHGHGVDRVSQRLRRAVVGGKAVEVKLARRAVGEFFRSKLHIMAAQKRFLAADNIKAAERSGLQIRFEAALSLGSGVVRLFLPFAYPLMVMVPDRSVRKTAAPAFSMRRSVSSAGCPNRLSAPTEMSTASGRMARRSASDVDVAAP